ncbi:hypothetical protein BC628DRAFT_1325485 [Trametes gibbosa]|nr:hypothetical protein BC628DRAFT_1325485 [Trametes gibbosa]
MEAYNVPMALDLTLSHTDGLVPALAMSRNRRHVHNARGHTIGPMPPAMFVDTFLPSENDKRETMMTFRNAFKAVPRTADTPSAIYKPLAAALNKKSPRRFRCPGFVFDTSIERSVRPLRLGYTKPHICCFTTANAKAVKRADNRTRVELGYAEFFIDVRPDPSFDFFIDPPIDANEETLSSHNFFREYREEDEDAEYDQAERAFGLHIAFVIETLARQNRTSLFTVSIFGPYARLYRWDREGCIITEAFDFHEHPDMLLEFFWRYSQASSIERGHDHTTMVAKPELEMLFRDAVRAHVRSQLGVEGPELDKAVGVHYERGHATVIKVYPQPLPETTEPDAPTLFVVSRPVVSPLSLEGRGTRGYWALHVDRGDIVFLKDTWRSWPGHELEGDILTSLNECYVRHVPRQGLHGLVPHDTITYKRTGTSNQLTQTNLFGRYDWVCRIDGKRIQRGPRRHYRMVTDAAGYNLKTLQGTEELLHATYDVFTAMRDALTKAARIHCDLSVGNIVLVKESGRDIRRGYLIDWEASTKVDSDGYAEHAGRVGTWDFMSIRMLNTRGDDKHRFEDDMESLFYVVLYSSLLYLPHSFCADDLTSFIKEIFRDTTQMLGITYGGGGKISNAMNRTYTRLVQFRSSGFQEWVNTIMDYFWPPINLKEQYKDMWDPARIDAYWAEFLQTQTLERDDRVVHEISNRGHYDRNSPPTTPGRQSDALATVRKRPLEVSDSEHTQRERKARAVEGEHSQPTRAARGHSATTPRRSERIRHQQQHTDKCFFSTLEIILEPSAATHAQFMVPKG